VKKLIIAAVLALCIVPAVAGASIIVSDHFGYANGNLVGAVPVPPLSPGGWYDHSGWGTKMIQVNYHTISVVQSTGGAADDNLQFYASRTTYRDSLSVTYAAFTLKVAPGSVMGTVRDYFAHFRPWSVDSNNFVSRVTMGASGVGGDYLLGITPGGSGITGDVTMATGLTFGRSYRIVIRYEPQTTGGTTGTSTLWVDPVNEASPSISATAVAGFGKKLASFAFRQSAPTGATITQVIDDLHVGTTFADVVPFTEVPTMSQWGLLILASMLVITGVFYVVRRRTALA
jgi:hypothetical protein